MIESQPEPPIDARLHKFLPLLACPTCRDPLRIEQSGLKCNGCARRFPIRKGVPILLPEDMQEPGAGDCSEEDPVSKHPYSPAALDIVHRAKGWVLDLGAGGKFSRFDNVIQLDIFRYPMTDIVGSADSLPFRDNAFEAVISQAVFEHLQYPEWAAAEIRRVLQPGGFAKIDTAFLQPEHGYPFHFFNASETGLRHWFRDFDIEWSGVEPYQHPKWALSWFLGVYLDRIGNQSNALLRRTTLGELIAALDRSARGDGAPSDTEILRALDELPPAAQRVLAAGVSVHVVNRVKHAPEGPVDSEVGRQAAVARREETRKMIAIREEMQELLSIQESMYERDIISQDKTRYLAQFYPGRTSLAHLGVRGWVQFRLVALLRLILPRPAWFYLRRAAQKRRHINVSLSSQKKTGLRPFLSIVVEPSDPLALTDTFFSLVRQTYSNWELLVVESAQQSSALRRAMADFGMLDERVRIVPESFEFSQVFTQARGEFCVRVPDGASLAFDAIRHFVTLSRNRPDTACILTDYEYSDEESIRSTRCIASPVFGQRIEAMLPWYALVSAAALDVPLPEKQLTFVDETIAYIPKVLFRFARRRTRDVRL